jgi:hypothetical protein
MWNSRDQERKRTERVRGYIIYLLYKARPRPLELALLADLLDARNFPVSRRRLAEEVDYLRSLRFLRIFPLDAESELSEVEQAKLMQRYPDCDSDAEMGMVLAARLTTAGINFQEGTTLPDGLQRVE